MSLLTIILTAIGISLAITGIKMTKYILSAKKEHSLLVFDNIDKWYRSVAGNEDQNIISGFEKEIDHMFEKKVLKTSVLNFTDKFIADYLDHISLNSEAENKSVEFEKLAGTGLKKSRQSLKILSLTYGYNYNLANYSYLNYWYILRGNYSLYNSGKADSEGKNYTLKDISEPFEILRYYFKGN
ncbi:MAG TPA: hypothetical protein PLK90_06435 [Clostridiales bacterium]|jgi:hypothetical protein|nr:hypothetical protein [Clostridiales bacterium]HQP70020.1 hypothetical protein [Clostridiales bacterium]